MHQNEALGPVITKTGSRGRPRPRDPKLGVILGHLGSKFKKFSNLDKLCNQIKKRWVNQFP